MSTRELIDAIESGDSRAIQSSFEAAISDRVVERLDTMRQSLAQNMFRSQDVESVEMSAATESVEQQVEEEAEQLDELKPATIKSYKLRSGEDLADLKDQEKEVKRDIKRDPEDAEFHKDTLSRTQQYIKRRTTGLKRAEMRK